MPGEEKTEAELQAEERELAIARGDIIPDDEEGKPDDDGPGEVSEGEGDGGGETPADDDPDDGDEKPAEEAGDPEGGEGDGEAGDGEAGEEGGEEKPIMIPKARFDEAQQKARDKLSALQTKLAKTEADHQVATTTADVEALEAEIDVLEGKWESHLMEGELDKAQAVRKEMRQKENKKTQTLLTQQSQQTGNAAVEQIRYETKLAMYETKYPVLNPDSDDYNKAVETEVGELKDAFELQGWGSTAALERAIKYAIPKETPQAEEEKPDPSIRKQQRAHQARKEAAAAAKATPPDSSKAGRDSDKGGKGDGLPDVGKMTPDQFAKWSSDDPAALAKLRGDTLSTEEAAA